MSTFHLQSISTAAPGGGGTNPGIYQHQHQQIDLDLDVRALLNLKGGNNNFGPTPPPMKEKENSSLGSPVPIRSGPTNTTTVLPINTVIRRFNRFFLEEDCTLPLARGQEKSFLDSPRLKECIPFIVEGYRVGVISKNVLEVLKDYPDVFVLDPAFVTLAEELNSYESRSDSLARVLKDMRMKNTFITLKGWRNECFEARISLEDPSLFKMERAATCIFGIRQFGVDISGYVRHPEKGLCIWMQRRSQSKQRWPGMWDNMVGGGLEAGFSVLETAYKEAVEEASIPKKLLRNLKEAGCVSIFFESERGLSPNTEYVYELELPLDFVPKNQDGEVSEFQLLPAEEALKLVLSPKFKTTSIPVALDFLIRHGILTSEIEPDLETYKSFMRIPLKDFYRKVDNKGVAEEGKDEGGMMEIPDQ